MTPSLTVVKLGGSYATSSLLRSWLRAIEAAAGSVVLVPGGGPFADAVRAAQPVMGFDEAAADEMALLAMAQFGRALVSLGERCVMAEDETAICGAIAAAQVPVWAPLRMRQQAQDLPASWDVTSDSLALWLAIRLDAAQLLVVKHRAVAPGDDLPDLAETGVVDPVFPGLAVRFEGEIRFVGPDVTAIIPAAVS
jgi:dihydroneopterin aldolase